MEKGYLKRREREGKGNVDGRKRLAKKNRTNKKWKRKRSNWKKRRSKKGRRRIKINMYKRSSIR